MIRVKLAKTLKSRGKTAYWLAKESGLVQATIYDLINGKKAGIDFKTLDIICRTLDCQPNDVLEYIDEDNTQATTSEKEMKRHKKK